MNRKLMAIAIAAAMSAPMAAQAVQAAQERAFGEVRAVTAPSPVGLQLGKLIPSKPAAVKPAQFVLKVPERAELMLSLSEPADLDPVFAWTGGEPGGDNPIAHTTQETNGALRCARCKTPGRTEVGWVQRVPK